MKRYSHLSFRKLICLYCLQSGHSSGPSPRSAPLTESFRQLPGHSGRVTCLSWSPHQSELLLSSSYDGTAQVRKQRGFNVGKSVLCPKYFMCVIYRGKQFRIKFSPGVKKLFNERVVVQVENDFPLRPLPLLSPTQCNP